MSPKSQTITFKFTGRLCDVWERGPKTSQDSVMEQAIQDNLFPARLRCRLWRIEMRWNELLAPLIVLQLTHTSVRLNPIERLGSKFYWRAAQILRLGRLAPWQCGHVLGISLKDLRPVCLYPKISLYTCHFGGIPSFWTTNTVIPSFSILLFALSEGPDSQLLTPLQRWTISGYNKTADGKWVCATGYNGTARNRCELGETWLTAKLSVGLPVGSQCWFQALLGWIQRLKS